MKLKKATLLATLLITLSIVLTPTTNAAAPTDGLVGHWTFDEGSGSVAGDSAGVNNGTLTNGPTWTVGKVGGALSFDGVDDYVGVPFTAITGYPFTISAWANPTDTNVSTAEVVTTIGRNNSQYFSIGFTANSPLRPGLIGRNSSFDKHFGAYKANVGEWIHIVGVFNSPTERVLYINGTYDSQDTSSVPELTNANLMRIGGGLQGANFGNNTIDDVRIYNRALTTTEITDLYNSAGPIVSTCTSFTYSAYNTCQSNSTQSRSVTSSSPEGCIGGAPITTQSCTYVPSTDTTPPTTPTFLTTTPNSSSQITLNWTASSDAVGVTGYKVYRDTTLLTIITSTSYANSGLTPSTTYTYTVSAIDAAGNESTKTGIVSGTTQSGAVFTPSKSLLGSTSVNINGEAWTFRTPPPPVSQRQVLSTHPRLFLTQANLPGIRKKLADPVYASDMIALRSNDDVGDGMANALLYQLEGDTTRGNAAKSWLLAGDFNNAGGILETSGDWVNPILVFDWIYPLLSSVEKTQAFGLLKANFGYDHRTATDRGASRYWNDVWARQQELHYPILALAIAGDGIDDIWAQEVLDLVYSESILVMGPYGPNRGSGFLDMLASVSLDDGGGSQAGTYGRLGQGYYAMYLHSFLPMTAWETATGQPMWARSNYFRKLPEYWAYVKNKIPGNIGTAMPEILSGVYKNIDPNTAALARWQLNKWGRYPTNRLLVHRLILGDLRVTPKSPQELGLSTSKYIRGGDLFVSSRSWNDTDVMITAYSRYLDTNRFEPASGLFAIQRGQDPLAVGAEPSKEKLSAGFFSGLWIYEPSGSKFQDETYFGLGPSRAYDAYTAVSNPGYFPGGPDNIVINNTYRGISTEYSSLFKAPGVRTARQTIVHILDPNRDFVVVYNYTDIPDNLRRAWSMRLAVTPTIINGNSYSIPGMTTTMVAPENTVFDWVGGVGNEFKSPSPENVWYGNNRGGNSAGFSSDPGKAKSNGIGNLFVKPTDDTLDQLEFLAVMDVSDLTPVQVTRISDREVVFGNWRVSFTQNGKFTVTSVDGSIIPTSPTPQCSDSIDNDSDGLIDMSDPGCISSTDNDELNTLIPTPSLHISLRIKPEGKTKLNLPITLEIIDISTGKIAHTIINKETDILGKIKIKIKIKDLPPQKPPKYTYNIRISIPYHLSIIMKNISLTSELEFETEDLPAGNISGNDDKINEADWSYMNSKWGTKDSIADLNEDGIVNTLDWSFMNKNWSGR